ncbi:glycosyltransferase [Catenulispora sp. NF23]|uniref:Glycosyltransferase n=1 Tax=Catenulispora pinistramenti TaxID=2705254 RepID=A0ABS5L698_9ACTN|nr:glycosyltransferase [Catenulispora pinistramenti]MBS2538433.1 glycosyltransferase [Catenulispora pinistramenti]MBS2553872.1 glycosyltransferase [Catenulispora pinistramenti]
MTKVLHVITGLASGGAERQLATLLQHLPEECEVACLTEGGRVGERIRAGGFRVHDLRMPSNRDMASLMHLVKLVRDGGFDLVHTHLYRAHLYGRLAARMAGVRAIVATEHSLGRELIEGKPKDRLGVRGLYRASERMGRVTIAVSQAVADYLRAWRIERVEVIENGIDIREFRFDPNARTLVRKVLGIDTDAFVIGGVGRLDPDKHFEVLIEAACRIDGATALIVGAGPDRARLQRLANQLMPGRVHFTGDVGGGMLEIKDLLSAMDVFASPSPSETFGLAPLEAVACGLPAVYSDSPALDGLPGLGDRVARVPSRPDAFVSALREAADLKPVDRCAPPGALERYGVAEQALHVSELYRSVLAE